MAKLRILEVAPEATPFVKTGGLGDVVGALPNALAGFGHEVKVFLPKYRAVNSDRFGLTPSEVSVEIGGADGSSQFRIFNSAQKSLGAGYHFVENAQLFDRDGIYLDDQTGKDFPDNDDRFASFCRAVLAAVKALDWRPDIVHVHDWQAGLIPVYLKTVFKDDPFFANTRSVLTIHNLAYQGQFEGKRFSRLELPDALFSGAGPIEFYKKVNFLKAGISFADKITTVSPRYASEIQSTPKLGCGLEGVLRGCSDDLIGIINGVDYSVWSPSNDRFLSFKYHPARLSGKQDTKVELLNQAGLPIRLDRPLLAMITRLVDQKGLDLIEECAQQLFARDIQMIVLGTGEERYHEVLQTLQERYPDKLKVYLTFDEALAHRMEAGADIFLMPSRFEPCGLNQMYSLKYGTVPVVHEVGGLADTVVDYDATTSKGTGFVFRQYTAESMLEAVDRAVELFYRKRKWSSIQKQGMAVDFSWSRSAVKYIELFEELAGT